MSSLQLVVYSGACASPAFALVGVGITIARDPLHGSGQAAFPHPALTLGDNAHAA